MAVIGLGGLVSILKGEREARGRDAELRAPDRARDRGSSRRDRTAVRGHGRGRYRQAAVAWVDRLFDALDLDGAVLLGHSGGGLWALWYALARPDRVRRLVFLIHPTLTLPAFPPRSASDLIRR
jgi:pimeloyl-ACP methyl ester carboxylesterase